MENNQSNQPKQTFKELKHFAYLTIDELKDFERLFDHGVKTLTLNIRGRNSIHKEKSTKKALGVTEFYHGYVKIEADNMEVSNKEELKTLVKKLNELKLERPWVSRVVVELSDGNVEIWERRVFHTKDKEMQRDSGSQRLNALVVFKSTFEKAKHLQSIYGTDLVQPTNCAKVETRGEKIVCYGTMSEV